MTLWWAVGKQTGRVYVRGHSHAEVIRWINATFWRTPDWTGRNTGGLRPTFEEPLIVERIMKRR